MSQEALRKATQYAAQVDLATMRVCHGSVEHLLLEKVKEAYLAGYQAGFVAATTRTSPEPEVGK